MQFKNKIINNHIQWVLSISHIINPTIIKKGVRKPPSRYFSGVMILVVLAFTGILACSTISNAQIKQRIGIFDSDLLLLLT